MHERGVATRPGTHAVTELGYYRRSAQPARPRFSRCSPAARANDRAPPSQPDERRRLRLRGRMSRLSVSAERSSTLQSGDFTEAEYRGGSSDSRTTIASRVTRRRQATRTSSGVTTSTRLRTARRDWRPSRRKKAPVRSTASSYIARSTTCSSGMWRTGHGRHSTWVTASGCISTLRSTAAVTATPAWGSWSNERRHCWKGSLIGPLRSCRFTIPM